jgi:uncharacterized phage-associated protein
MRRLPPVGVVSKGMATMVSVNDVARYFLSKADPEAGDAISHLKLQKLVYYAQGFHLAISGEPLFPDPIEAWRHGPVVRSLYAQYAGYGANGIPLPRGFDPTSLPPDIRELLDEVYEVYGQYSAWRLRELTHAEPPWREAWDPDDPSQTISTERMKQYFEGLVDQKQEN